MQPYLIAFYFAIELPSFSIQSGDGAPPAPLWRLNMDSFLSNPNMTASFPAFDDGVTFEGRALFVAGERSKFTNRDDEPLIRYVKISSHDQRVQYLAHFIT